MTDPAAQAAALRREIGRHNYLYYIEDAPAVSDAEFDALIAALKAIEAEQLNELERFADKKTENLLAGIAAAKEQPLGGLLIGLGIRHVDGTIAGALADHCRGRLCGQVARPPRPGVAGCGVWRTPHAPSGQCRCRLPGRARQ
jgi:NAD-dependent DNA ligase